MFFGSCRGESYEVNVPRATRHEAVASPQSDTSGNCVQKWNHSDETAVLEPLLGDRILSHCLRDPVSLENLCSPRFLPCSHCFDQSMINGLTERRCPLDRQLFDTVEEVPSITYAIRFYNRFKVDDEDLSLMLFPVPAVSHCFSEQDREKLLNARRELIGDQPLVSEDGPELTIEGYGFTCCINENNALSIKYKYYDDDTLRNAVFT